MKATKVAFVATVRLRVEPFPRLAQQSIGRDAQRAGEAEERLEIRHPLVILDEADFLPGKAGASGEFFVVQVEGLAVAAEDAGQRLGQQRRLKIPSCRPCPESCDQIFRKPCPLNRSPPSMANRAGFVHRIFLHEPMEIETHVDNWRQEVFTRIKILCQKPILVRF